MLKRLIVGQVSSGQDKQKLMVYISLGKWMYLIFPQPCPKCFETGVYVVVFLKLMQKFSNKTQNWEKKSNFYIANWKAKTGILKEAHVRGPLLITIQAQMKQNLGVNKVKIKNYLWNSSVLFHPYLSFTIFYWKKEEMGKKWHQIPLWKCGFSVPENT